VKGGVKVCRAIAAYAAIAAASASIAYGAAPSPESGLTPSFGAAAPGNPSRLLIYTVDVPCAPGVAPIAAPAAAPTAAHRGVPHPLRLHRVRRPAPPAGVTPIPIALPRAAQISTLHEPVARPHHRRRTLAHRRPTVAAAPKGCVALRSERLDNADLAFYGPPAPALDFPVALLSTDLLDLDLSSKRKFYGDGGATLPGSGGGDTWGGTTGPVRGVPEPQAWMLMILGVGLCGAALRRDRRRAARLSA
jgi:hypothetical protein